MWRKCDGKDPNLVMYLDTDCQPVLRRTDDEKAYPCNCGQQFDDVEQSTVFPHYGVRSTVCKLCGMAVLIVGSKQWVELEVMELPHVDCDHVA